MTIKKIGLSALVAATLTTAGFAAGTLTFKPVSFNTKFLASQANDLNISSTQTTTGIAFVSSANIAKDSKIEFTLTDGAKFLGEAGTWFLTDTANDKNATGVQISADGKVLTMQADTDIASGGDLNLTTNNTDITKFNEYNLSISTGATADIKMNIIATTLVGGDKTEIQGARVTDASMFTKNTDDVKGKLVCSDKIYIDSDNKPKFYKDANSPGEVTSDTEVTCAFSVDKPTRRDIDFNYADLNITLELTGGNFTEGNLTSPADVVNDATHMGITANATHTGYTYQYKGTVAANELNSTALASTLTYTLDPATVPLNSVEFGHTAKIKFNALTDNNATFDIIESGSTDMKWTLATYTARVVGVRDTATDNTYLKIINNSVNDGVAVTMDISNSTADQTGVSLGTVDAGKALIFSSTQLKSKVTGDIGNGYTVDISMNIPSKQGDMIISYINAGGQFNGRVVDNNPDNNGN